MSFLRREKRRYYEILNEKSVVDNKVFWKTVKLLLSDKVVGKEKIYLNQNNELVKTDLETDEALNLFQYSTEP